MQAAVLVAIRLFAGSGDGITILAKSKSKQEKSLPKLKFS